MAFNIYEMLLMIPAFIVKTIWQLWLWYRQACNYEKGKRSEDKIACKMYCEPCEKENETKQAYVWCNDCEEGFCAECVKGHATKTLRYHHLISIDDHEKVKGISIGLKCEIHKRKREYFCCQHDHTLCLKCLQLEHSKCEIIELKDAAEGIKQSVALSDLEDVIKELLHNIEISIRRCKNSSNNLQEYEQTIRRQLTHMRNTVNEHLDKLQHTLLSELDSYCEGQNIQIKDCQNYLVQEETDFRQLQSKLSVMKQFASETQTFIGIKQMDKTVYTHKMSIKDKIAAIPSCKFKLEISQSIQSILTDVSRFGEIISKDENLTSYTELKENQAQLPCTPAIQSSKDINRGQRQLPRVKFPGVTLQLRQNICIKKFSSELNVTSCVILPNKKLMFAECNSKRLVIHDEKGAFEYYITLYFPPFDIAVLNENTVAVTYRCQNKRIDVIDIHTYTISELVSDSDEKSYTRWGISGDNEIIYVVSYPEGVEMLETASNTVRTIKNIDVHNVFNITSNEDKVYYRNKKNDSLFCYNTSGSMIWKFRDAKLSCGVHSFGSLTSDTHGNIYLVGPLEDIVMLVTDEGRSKTIILDKSDKLATPRAIFFDKNTDKLLVCNQTNGHAALYDVIENN